MASLQIHQSTISSMAEHIVRARRLYGADSAYVIGMFQGIELLLVDTEAVDLRQQLQDQVIKLEGNTSEGRGSTGSQEGGGTTTVKGAEAPASADGNVGLAENTWVKGAVKWFNNDKGYGFISTAADADVFVHWRDISSWDRSLAQGDEVEFMVTKTAKGFQAINVMKPGTGGEATTEATPEGKAPAAAAREMPPPDHAETPAASPEPEAAGPAQEDSSDAAPLATDDTSDSEPGETPNV